MRWQAALDARAADEAHVPLARIGPGGDFVREIGDGSGPAPMDMDEAPERQRGGARIVAGLCLGMIAALVFVATMVWLATHARRGG